MSGTIGTTLHRWSARPAVVVLRPQLRLRQVASTVRAHGGLRPLIAVPVAALLTGSVLWTTITVAGALVA